MWSRPTDGCLDCKTPVETSTTPEFRCMGYADISVSILTHSFISVKPVSVYFLEKTYSIQYNSYNVTVQTPLSREVFWHVYAKILRPARQNSIAKGDFIEFWLRICEGTEQIRYFYL